MKAYKAWDNGAVELYSTVVFAESAKEAKKIAFTTDVCENAEYIDVRVLRLPEMDKHYRGRSEINWDDEEGRRALVELGWRCFETSWECDTCKCRDICLTWESEFDET